MAAGEITQLLEKWGDGDPTALDQLILFVYDELRQLARSYLRRQPHSITIQPTALIHEAYLRLAGKQQLSFKNRAQFFGLAAKLIHDLLIDYLRRRHSGRRRSRCGVRSSGNRLTTGRPLASGGRAGIPTSADIVLTRG